MRCARGDISFETSPILQYWGPRRATTPLLECLSHCLVPSALKSAGRSLGSRDTPQILKLERSTELDAPLDTEFSGVVGLDDRTVRVLDPSRRTLGPLTAEEY